MPHCHHDFVEAEIARSAIELTSGNSRVTETDLSHQATGRAAKVLAEAADDIVRRESHRVGSCRANLKRGKMGGGGIKFRGGDYYAW